MLRAIEADTGKWFHFEGSEGLPLDHFAVLMEGDPQESFADFEDVLRTSHTPHLLAWAHVYLGRLYDIKDPPERQQAYAAEATIRPLTVLDPKALQVLAARSVDPRLMVAMAFQEIAANATKVGNLNISPDLLDSLLHNGQDGEEKHGKRK